MDAIITYRHLLSTAAQSTRDPLRVIALCDSDAFYAACEQIRLNLDPTAPLVVLQWESIIAVNYPARTFGISRMEKIGDAKRRCKELTVVHVATYKEGDAEPGYWDLDDIDSRTHKVSLDLYRRESTKIINMFKAGLPSGEIEKASIDEAFIDFSRPVREVILARFPYLATVPADAPHGIDTPLPAPPPISWDGLGALIPINPGSDTEEAEDDGRTTWHDVALSIAAELMDKVRKDVHTKLGYSTSAGIARNKFLAKLSASYKKPNSQSILRNAAIPAYLRPMAFKKIRFLGGKLGDALAKEYDVATVGDLLTITLEEMQRKFGENSIWVYEILRGIDRSEVKEKPAQTKSMMAAKNLPKPITRFADGYHWIRVLAAELALRLADARKEVATVWPKSIVLHAKQGYETSRSKQASFPFLRGGEATVDDIAAAGGKLWAALVPQGNNIKITSVTLGFSGLEAADVGQKSIEGFLNGGGAGPSKKRGRVERHIDEEETEGQRREAGTGKGFWCEACGKQIGADQEGDGEEWEAKLVALKAEHADWHFARMLARGDGDSIRAGKRRKGKEKVGGDEDEESVQEVGFTCPRCRKHISLTAADVGEEAGAKLELLKAEHEDFHFAQSVARGADVAMSTSEGRERESPKKSVKSNSNSKGKGKQKEKGKEAEGIAKFFMKK